MPRTQLTPAQTRALLAQIKPGARLGKLTVRTVTYTNRPNAQQRYHIVSDCDCGSVKTGYVREYIDALRRKRPMACRSCFSKASVGRQWAARKDAASSEERRLAKLLFLRHRRACAKLGVGAEVAESWMEFIPDAKEMLEQAAGDGGKWFRSHTPETRGIGLHCQQYLQYGKAA